LHSVEEPDDPTEWEEWLEPDLLVHQLENDGCFNNNTRCVESFYSGRTTHSMNYSSHLESASFNT
jgi:hypothetical protein